MNIHKSSTVNIRLDESVLLLFVLSVFFVPHVASVIHAGIFFLWSLFALLRNANALIRAAVNKRMLAVSFFLIFYFVAAFFEDGKNGFSYALWSTFVQILYIVSGLIMFEFYQNQNSRKRNRKIAIFCVLIVAITQIAFLTLYHIHSISARHFVAGESWEEYADIWLASPYGIIVAGTLISATFVYFCLNKTQVKLSSFSRFLAMIFVILSLIFVIAGESTISILIFVLGVAISAIASVSKNSSRMILFSIFSAILVVLFFIEAEEIATYLITLKDSGIVGEKFAAIGEILLGTAAGNSHVTARLDAYKVSFEVIRENLLFGNGLQHGVSYSPIYASGHSEVLDTFARFGIIGGGAYLFHLLSFGKRFLCLTKSKTALICCIVFLIHSTLNQVYYMSAWFSFFFVCPMLATSTSCDTDVSNNCQ